MGSKYKHSPGPPPKSYILRDGPTTQSFAEWIMPIVAEKQKVANNIIPTKFWQYNQLRYRVCSCYTSVSDPDPDCLGCFGTGFLPGFSPLGYYSWVVLDVTDPGTVMNNLMPLYNSGRHPFPLQLVPTALNGSIESDWLGCSRNKGTLETRFSASPGVTFQYSLDGLSWNPLVSNGYDANLVNANQIKFRANLSRASLDDDPPFVQCLHVKILVQDDPFVSLDVPRWVHNLSSDDQGIIPILNTFNGYSDSSAKLEQTSIFIHSVSKRKFKTLSLNPNMPDGILTSWDVELRLIQPDESLNNIA